MNTQQVIGQFREGKGTLSLFVSEGTAPAELLVSNPLAGFCLAMHAEFRKPAVVGPLTVARHLADKPQREILAWLGFRPATEAVAKIGRKCLPRSLGVARCLRFRQALADATVRAMLAHVPRVNAGVMGLVSTPALVAYVTPQLLKAAADKAEEEITEAAAETLLDVHEMRLLVRRGERAPRFNSIAEIRKDHRALVREANRPGALRLNPTAFPPPPFGPHRDGNLQILPITSRSALQALGRERDHPIIHYTAGIWNGTKYLYHVLAWGERGCLWLERNFEELWVVHELESLRGQPVSPGVRARIVQWLTAAQPQRLPPAADLTFEFPAPPFPAFYGLDLEIVPMTTLTDLQTLGRHQHNCVAAYAGRVRRGTTYIYRVKACGENCTLALGKAADEPWRIAQLEAACNRRASHRTHTAVENWLREAAGC